MQFELSIFYVFKGFKIFLCQIHLPLENKSMFLHPKVSFSVIFFENEYEGKSKIYFNFSWQFIFFSQNNINYPVSSVSWRINFFSKKKRIYFSSEKRNICNFTKKVFFTKKVTFLMIFCLFLSFHQTIHKKH